MIYKLVSGEENEENNLQLRQRYTDLWKEMFRARIVNSLAGRERGMVFEIQSPKAIPISKETSSYT